MQEKLKTIIEITLINSIGWKEVKKQGEE